MQNNGNICLNPETTSDYSEELPWVLWRRYSLRKFELKVKLPKTVRRNKEALSKEVIIDILNACSNIRLKTYVMFLACTGCRCRFFWIFYWSFRQHLLSQGWQGKGRNIQKIEPYLTFLDFATLERRGFDTQIRIEELEATNQMLRQKDSMNADAIATLSDKMQEMMAKLQELEAKTK